MTVASLMVPCSYGEAFDKLTILQLKLDNIQDARRADVETEYMALKKIMEHLLPKAMYHYDRLLEVNRIMWKIQDELHNSLIKSDPMREFDLMRKINDVNERRFRIKRTINTNLGSTLKEQKGYKGKRAFVLSHLGMGDMFFMNGAIRYLATQFDEVMIGVKAEYEKNVRTLYSDEPSVTFYVVYGDTIDISPNYGGTIDRLREVADGFDLVAMLGYHGTRNVENFPYCFYKDLGLESKTMMSWAHVETTSILPIMTPFRFVHSHASNAEAPIQVDIEEMLVINPVKNMYSVGHKWHATADKWVDLPILEYVGVMRNAKECLMVDSSFFCLALTLGLKPTVWCRNGRSYKNVCEDLVEHMF